MIGRRGVTLPELLLAMTVALLLAAIASSSLAGALAAASVRAARSELRAAIDRARTMAVVLEESVALSFDGSDWVVRADSDPGAGLRLPGPAVRGVAVEGMRTPLVFGPSGLATGVANRTVTFRRNEQILRLVISRLGRVR